jgi:hypothetical protein
MRYLTIFSNVERDTPPSPEEIATMEELIKEWSAKGKLIATEGCLPTALGARVRRDGDTITVTDGPFTEAKEVVGGFAILEVDSKEEAIELTKVFLDVVGDGVSEIRELYPVPAYDGTR